jgi:hypothetical protein
MWNTRYNTYRPHHGVEGITSMEYVNEALEVGSLIKVGEHWPHDPNAYSKQVSIGDTIKCI